MSAKRPFSLLLIACRIPVLLAWLIIVPVPFMIARLFSHSVAVERLPMMFHRVCCRIFGIRVKISGQMCLHRPTLYISNHVSYLDIFALGGIVPGYFIAKSEVANWPVFGKLARLQNTLFIERHSRHARAQVKVLQNQLAQGGNLILFPEGTSTDGIHVEPFKSSLFHAADAQPDQDILIQPMTLAYTKYRGKVMPQSIRDYYAWYGTMPFLSHFIQALGMRSAEVELIFHAPVKLQDFKSRKACAESCWQQVSHALDVALGQKSAEVMNNDDYPPTSQINAMD